MTDQPHVYRFGDWSFDPCTGELDCPRARVRLAPKPALVLAVLLDNPGRLVARQTIKDRVWPDSIIDVDRRLNFCIREIRAALGDRAANAAYIETCARRGYRFLVAAERGQGGRPVESAGSPSGANETPRATRRGLYVVAVAVVSISALSIAFIDAPEREPVPAAVEAAEKGGYLLTRGNAKDVTRSIGFFRQAIASSPDYARAWAGLGAALMELDRASEGKAALQESLALDSRQWAPHLTLARHALYKEYDRRNAARYFRRALALAPDNVVVRHTFAWFEALQGHTEDAILHMTEALRLDPVSPRVNGDVGRLFYFAGRYEDAIAQCEKTVELTGDRLLHSVCLMHALTEMGALGRLQHRAGRTREVRISNSTSSQQHDEDIRAAALAAYWRRAASDLDRQVDEQKLSPVYAAAAWARAGVPERALDRLQQAVAIRCPLALEAGIDPAFQSLNSHAEYRELLRQIQGDGAES